MKTCLAFLVLNYLLYCITCQNQNANVQTSVVCFSNNTLVETLSNGFKRVSELNYGDMVKTVDTATGKVDYSKFIDYLHYDKSIKSEFITIETNNSYLEISELHLIQRKLEDNNHEFVYARDLKLDDEIFVVVNDQMTIEKITKLGRKQEIGAFAPLTESGTILVNNVLASCYANCQSHTLSHIALAPLRLWHKLFSYEISNEKSDFIHSYATFLRVFEFTPFSMIIYHY